MTTHNQFVYPSEMPLKNLWAQNILDFTEKGKAEIGSPFFGLIFRIGEVSDMAVVVVPAIIASTQAELDEMLSRLKGKVRRAMLDVMDGRFVENRSLDFNFRLPPWFEYEAHLMVEDPLERIEDLAGKVGSVILHVEALHDIEAALETVKGCGLKVSLALNPESEVEVLKPYLGVVDGVLVMTVEPGQYGGRFLPETLSKCRKLREMHDSIPIEVDGGMNPHNSRAARDAGASVIASGSFIMKSGDIDDAVLQLST
jgi:ribulose-phosphate 3-epimerase